MHSAKCNYQKSFSLSLSLFRLSFLGVKHSDVPLQKPDVESTHTFLFYTRFFPFFLHTPRYIVRKQKVRRTKNRIDSVTGENQASGIVRSKCSFDSHPRKLPWRNRIPKWWLARYRKSIRIGDVKEEEGKPRFRLNFQLAFSLIRFLAIPIAALGCARKAYQFPIVLAYCALCSSSQGFADLLANHRR